MRWTRDLIIAALRRRHRRGQPIASRALAQRHRALLSAAVYHYGSLAAAVTASGLDYDDVSRRPRWTKERVIRQLKAARRKGTDLSWAAAIRRPGPLRRAAFAARRLFGTWARSLGAAGVDVDEWRRYRTWDKTSIALDLRQRHVDGEPMNSGAVQRDEPSLHAAAIRYFGSFDEALRAARVSPTTVRMRKKIQ